MFSVGEVHFTYLRGDEDDFWKLAICKDYIFNIYWMFEAS